MTQEKRITYTFKVFLGDVEQFEIVPKLPGLDPNGDLTLDQAHKILWNLGRVFKPNGLTVEMYRTASVTTLEAMVNSSGAG